MRPAPVPVWSAVAGVLLAVLFVTLGDVSQEPSDHPRWLMAGYWPVVIAYMILMGFCLPGFLLNFVLMTIVPDTLGYHGLGGRPGDVLNYLTYPLVQGVLYGGVVWAMMSIGRAVRNRLPRREVSPEITTLGSNSGARPCRRSRWRLLGIVTIFVISYSVFSLWWLLPQLPPFWTADYDRERYAQISLAIKADKHHLVGKSLDEVIRLLGLENVPWDNGFTKMVDGENRIYHFRGFALYLSPRLFPPGIRPDSGERWTGSGEELHRHGVLWLDYFHPFVRVDGMADPKERMKQHWKKIDEECARINARMEQERQRNS